MSTVRFRPSPPFNPPLLPFPIRILQIAAVAALAAFAVWLCLHYGPLGLNPVDQPILFDGGWRILSGQLPFRDFWTPVGIVPSFMQAAVFAVAGVSWFTYNLHAAIVNALFALVVFDIARRLGAGFLSAWLMGLASAVYFYPAFGVPYMDQHSFFFSACCLWASIAVSKKKGNAPAALLAAPVFAAAALLSKIVPATFIVGPCLLFTSALGLRARPRWALAGIAIPVAGAVAYAVAIHASVHSLVEYSFTLPFHTASARTVLYPAQATDATFAARATHVWREWLELLVFSRTLVLGLWLAALGALAVTRRADTRRSRVWALLGVSAWLAATTAVFTYITNNAASNALGLLPLVVGTAWMAFDSAFREVRGSSLRAAGVVVAALTIATAGADVWRFNKDVTASRALNRLNVDLPRWSVPGRMRALVLHDNAYLFDIRDILPYVESRPENFLVFGDSIWLYGATGHPSLFPALWFHPGLTIPEPGSPDFAFVDERAAANIRRYHAAYIIQEGSRTRMQARLEDFPRLSATVDGCPEHAVGGWTIREICH